MKSLLLNLKLQLFQFLKVFLRAGDFILIFASVLFVRSYQVIAGPVLGGACRFEPTCSAYALEALKTHKFIFAWKLIMTRILRCRPGGSFGWDPVPSGSHSHCCHN